MKKILSVVMVIILIISLLTGCSGNGAGPKSTLGDVQAGPTSDDSSPAGKYILVSWEDENGDYLDYLISVGINPETIYLELRSDGTYTWDLSVLDFWLDEGTYEIKGDNTLILTYDDGEDELTIADGRIYFKADNDTLIFDKSGNTPPPKAPLYGELAGKYILESWNYRFPYWDKTDDLLRFGTDPADNYIELFSDGTYIRDTQVVYMGALTALSDGKYIVDGDTVTLIRYSDRRPNGIEDVLMLDGNKLIMEDTGSGEHSMGYSVVFVKEGTAESASTPAPAPAVPYSESYFGSQYGSAKLLEGKILLISIILDTSESSFSSYYATFETPPGYLGLRMAKRMIEGEAGKYGKSVEVIFDVSPGSDLVYETKIDDQIYKYSKTGANIAVFVRNTFDFYDFIENNIPYLELADKYQTDNIAYLVFVNEAGICYAHPYSRAKECHIDGLPSDALYHERTVIYYPVADGRIIFHEILHLFGVPDYYRGAADEDFGVSEEFVEHVYNTYPQEIMLNPDSGEETNSNDDRPPCYQISSLTAYRLGWLDDIPELELFPNFRNPGGVPGLWAPYWYEP